MSKKSMGPIICERCGTQIQVHSKAYKDYHKKMCAYCQVEMAKMAIERIEGFIKISNTPQEEADWLKTAIIEYRAQCIATSDIIQHLTGQLKELQFYNQIGKKTNG